jgi:hypothetical protein
MYVAAEVRGIRGFINTILKSEWGRAAGPVRGSRKKHEMKLFVVTATNLRDGAIRWLGAGGVWQASLANAEPFDEAGIAPALAFGAAEISAQRVIGVYKVEVHRGDDGLDPLSTRERIRAFGPTVHPAFSYAPATSGLGD